MHKGLKRKGYNKNDFLKIPGDATFEITDKLENWDYGFLLQDIKRHFADDPVSIETAKDCFFYQKKLPVLLGTIAYVNRKVRHHTGICYARFFMKNYKFQHGCAETDELITVQRYLQENIPHKSIAVNFYIAMIAFVLYCFEYEKNGDKLYSDFKKENIPADCDEIIKVQKFLETRYYEARDQLKQKRRNDKSKKQESATIKHEDIAKKLWKEYQKSEIEQQFFSDNKEAVKIISEGLYRNEIAGHSYSVTYQTIARALFDGKKPEFSGAGGWVINSWRSLIEENTSPAKEMKNNPQKNKLFKSKFAFKAVFSDGHTTGPFITEYNELNAICHRTVVLLLSHMNYNKVKNVYVKNIYEIEMDGNAKTGDLSYVIPHKIKRTYSENDYKEIIHTLLGNMEKRKG